MNKSTPGLTIATCSLVICALASPALANDRATPHAPKPPPQTFMDGKDVPGWDIVEFTVGTIVGEIHIVPHSDGLEPPLMKILLAPVADPLDSLLGNPSFSTKWGGDDWLTADTSFDGGFVTPGAVSAVPAPGSAVLLLGAAGAAAYRRRRH